MRLLFIPLFFCLACCKPKAPETPQSHNTHLPRLPVAASAEKIEGKSIHFIELQYADEKWNVDGGLPTDDDDEVTRLIKSAKDGLTTKERFSSTQVPHKN